MANEWTQERRKRQSLLIRTWDPSSYSTGPRTELGKACSSLNALKHGGRSRHAKEDSVMLKLTLQKQLDILNQTIQLVSYDDSQNIRC